MWWVKSGRSWDEGEDGTEGVEGVHRWIVSYREGLRMLRCRGISLLRRI